MSDETHYTVLGISEAATQDEIDRRYRNLIEAYHVLSDSTQRSSYNQQLAQHRQQNAPASTAPPKTTGTPPPPYTSSPSTQPQPQVGRRGIDWRDFAPLAGVLFVFAPWYILVVLARWSSARLWSLFH
jgi:curved DNA-binding protein CbpA